MKQEQDISVVSGREFEFVIATKVSFIYTSREFRTEIFWWVGQLECRNYVA